MNIQHPTANEEWGCRQDAGGTLGSVSAEAETAENGASRQQCPTSELRVRKAFWGGIGRTFRGEIWEDDANVGLSQDAAQGNKPFDIDTCRYWKPVLEAANRAGTRLIVLTAANQIGKTLVCELIARHKIKHEPAHMVLYDQTDEANEDHMKTRFMPFLRSIPDIAAQISEVIEASSNGRFNVTQQDILLPGMILRGRALNESNTQRITVRYMFVHDACLSERNGQLRRARIRLTQFLGKELLVVESQGGAILEGVPDDFTELVKETNDADLYVRCPFCERAQIFTLSGWTRKRGDDFRATLTREKIREIEAVVITNYKLQITKDGLATEAQRHGGGNAEHRTSNIEHRTSNEEGEGGQDAGGMLGGVPSGEGTAGLVDSTESRPTDMAAGEDGGGLPTRRYEDIESCRRDAGSALNHAIGFAVAWAERALTETLMSEGRRGCGFRRGDELLAKMGEGLFNEKDIMAHTCYECHDCGSIWNDTPEMRRALDHSSHYVPTNGTAGRGKLGFRVPAWICPRLSWGQIMLEKVLADNAAAVGNDLPLQEWETKRGAATYDPKRHMARVASVTTTIDPLLAIPNEKFRSMEVDCQKDKQLSERLGQDMTGHFWVTAFATDAQGNDVQLWRGYCVSWEEWIAKAKELRIPTMNISVDASYKPDEIKARAARHAELVTGPDGGKIWATWTMMRGSDAHSFRWEDGVAREYKIERPEEATVYVESRGSRAEGGEHPASNIQHRTSNETGAISSGEGTAGLVGSTESRPTIVRTLKINVITWSNFRVKNILHAQLSRMPGAPGMKVLPDKSNLLSDRTRAMETGDCAWDSQLNSEILGKAGKKTQWVEVHRENHYRDDCCMHIVRKIQAGLQGRMEIAVTSAQREE